MTALASPITLTTLRNLKRNAQKFACLTAYDASFAQLCEDAGVEVVLVGDSLGMVIQGHDSTLPVTLNDMIYHTANVRRATRHALVMADMPFMTYVRAEQAVFSAGRLMKEGGAHMVKLEGGAAFVETVRAMATNGIPVCAHLGLLPQSVNKLGGYRVQGKDEASATAMLNDARAMQDAGADIVLLECVPATLAAQITKALEIPVIGIGAGVDCDSQVLVIYDMLGITPGKRPKFSHDFLRGQASVSDAIAAYVSAVKSGTFPAVEHSF
ncbi:MAG: 3-methyl-2-oxobutanoate hydroxymethyltransferase [Gammaproteobacteria bacterium]|nr:3-methyl-2-oxobutanoate hydroxymethyltransferase [Gammaproteobacteria bacterium]